MKARARGIQNAQLICSTLLSRLWGGTRATWEPREHSTSSCGLQSSSPELGSCSPNLHPTYAKDTSIYSTRTSRGGGRRAVEQVSSNPSHPSVPLAEREEKQTAGADSQSGRCRSALIASGESGVCKEPFSVPSRCFNRVLRLRKLAVSSDCAASCA